MKIRNGFVTNSSSSSYVIAFKDIKKHESWDLFPEFVKKIINKYIEMAVHNGEIINTIEELDAYFLDIYGYDSIAKALESEGPYLFNQYDNMLTAIKDGYSLSDLNMDYSDETGNYYYQSLPKEDDGTGLYLLSENG
jgi:hypothetical protein